MLKMDSRRPICRINVIGRPISLFYNLTEPAGILKSIYNTCSVATCNPYT